jgi:hypothetical protein
MYNGEALSFYTSSFEFHRDLTSRGFTQKLQVLEQTRPRLSRMPFILIDDIVTIKRWCRLEHIKFYYIHDSFIPFLFLFLLIAGGILRRNMAYLYVIFLVMKPLGIKKRTQILQIKVMQQQ